MRAVVGNYNNYEGRCACANKTVENERDDPASPSDYQDYQGTLPSENCLKLSSL